MVMIFISKGFWIEHLHFEEQLNVAGGDPYISFENLERPGRYIGSSVTVTNRFNSIDKKVSAPIFAGIFAGNIIAPAIQHGEPIDGVRVECWSLEEAEVLTNIKCDAIVFMRR